MSLVTLLRDYSESLATTSAYLTENRTILGAFQATIASVFHTLWYLFCYIASFQWFRDVTYLPLVAPQLSFSILNENMYPMDNSPVHMSPLLQPTVAQSNKLLVGLINSCFVSLPLSCAHIVAARRLLVEGVPAGVASGCGTVVAQCWLFTSVLCGLRGFLVPWLAMEPLDYVVGVCLLVMVVYRMADEKSITPVGWGQRRRLLSLFLINLALTLCEQAGVLFHLSNLSIGAEASYLESFHASTPLKGFISHSSYLLSFIVGSFLFTALFAGLALLVKGMWARCFSISNTRVSRQLNWLFQLLLITISFSSLPYYGMDYLFCKGVGFLPGDKALQQTVIYPDTLKRTGLIGQVSGGTSFDVDVVPFDRGRYIKPERRVSWSYEELNYQGESLWLRRYERLPVIQKKRLDRRWVKLMKESFNTVRNIPLEKSLRKDWSRLHFGLNGARERVLQAQRPVHEMNLHRYLERLRRGLPLFMHRTQHERYAISSLSHTVSSGLSSPVYRRGRYPVRMIEKRFKKRFYNSMLYRLLLRADIDTFLGRQPASHLLSPKQEEKLFRHRQMLARYYNSFREYRKMYGYPAFQYLNLGSKSYSDRVYNQQFKGTVKVARKLFAVTLNPYRNPFRRRVLKYDQPLPLSPTKEKGSKGGKERDNPLLHEEIDLESEAADPLCVGKGALPRTAPIRYNGGSPSDSPLIEEIEPRPLYAGWDEQLRKMVVTSRFLSRDLSPYRWRERRGIHPGDRGRLSSKGEISRFMGEKQLSKETPLPSLAKDGVTGNSRLAAPPAPNDKLPLPATNWDHKVATSPAGGGLEGGVGGGLKAPLGGGKRSISFTAWPIKKKRLSRPKSRSRVPYETIVESAHDPKNEPIVSRLKQFTGILSWCYELVAWGEISNWPENIRLLYVLTTDHNWALFRKVLPPTRGGFVWPGNQELAVDIKKLLGLSR